MGKNISRSRCANGVTIIVVILFFTVSTCNKERMLASSEVRTLFANKTIQGYHEKRRYSFRSYWNDTGEFRSYQNNSPTPRQGRWWIKDNGLICIRWQDTREEFCRNIVTDGQGHYRKILVKGNGVRILIVRYDSFVDGNPHSL